MIESLEQRRLMAGDLVFGDFVIKGSPLFQPGGTTELVVSIRDLLDVPHAAGIPVTFKYVDVGWSPNDEDASFDDPSAVALTTTPATTPNAIAANPAVTSMTVDITWPADLKAGRYELVGKVDDTNTVAESNENDNTRAFGAGWALPTNKNLPVNGTDAADRIVIAPSTKNGAASYLVRVNNLVDNFSARLIKAFTISAGGGNDVIIINGAVPKVKADGGAGNDRIAGGDLNDSLTGGDGADQIDGGGGNDTIRGGAGNDKLAGGAGADHLYGNGGNDYLDGGSSADHLNGGNGADTLLGQGGDDSFTANDHEVDQLFGGTGKDTAKVDPSDVLNSIEINS